MIFLKYIAIQFSPLVKPSNLESFELGWDQPENTFWYTNPECKRSRRVEVVREHFRNGRKLYRVSVCVCACVYCVFVFTRACVCMCTSVCVFVLVHVWITHCVVMCARRRVCFLTGGVCQAGTAGCACSSRDLSILSWARDGRGATSAHSSPLLFIKAFNCFVFQVKVNICIES